MGEKQIGLWKFNKITGYWELVRTCLPENKNEWLKVFQKDEPKEKFKLSKTRPRS